MKTVGKLMKPDAPEEPKGEVAPPKPDAPEEPKGEVAPPKRKGAGPSQATGN